MKLIFIFAFLSLTALAQSLSPEEQKKLIEENRALRDEVKFLKEEIIKAKTTQAVPQNSAQIMQVLEKGKTHQEEQNKALEELDQED